MKATLLVIAAIVALAAAAPSAGKWVQMIPTGPYFPQARFFHSQVSQGNQAYIFGGENGQSYFKDLFVYDTQQNIVELIDSGTGPSGRAGACAQILGAIVDTYVDSNNITQTLIVRNDTVVIFGGFDGTNYLNDVWEFNLGTAVWTKTNPANPPQARAFQACIEIGTSGAEELLVFGGTDGTNYFGVDDAAILNSVSGAWESVPDNTPTGAYPDGRAYATGINNGGNLYFYGGYNANGCLSDTWVWNANLTAWFSVPTASNPGPLAAYAGFGDGGAYEIFGGWANCNAASNQLWSLSHSRPNWALTTPSGALPPPRAATVASFHGSEYLMYAGATGSLQNGTLTVTTVYDDLWLYLLH